MNRVLVSLTAHQLLGRRRTALLALVLVLPVVIALVYRLSEDPDPTVTPTEYALGLVGGLIGNVLLPVVALVLGTAAMGSEIDDGTAVFLLTKPLPRWRIAVIKIGVAAASTIVLVVPATVATAWIVRGSPTAEGLAPGLGLAAGVAALLYCAVFVALSPVTSRALVTGLVYVFVWEATVTNLLAGLRWISIREYATGWADLLLSTSDPEAFDPRLDTGPAIVATVCVLTAAVAAATAALDRFQLTDRP